MKITKIYFPQVTAIKLEEEGMESRYFSSRTGGQTYPSEDVIVSEEDWREALRQARRRSLQIEVQEV